MSIIQAVSPRDMITHLFENMMDYTMELLTFDREGLHIVVLTWNWKQPHRRTRRITRELAESRENSHTHRRTLTNIENIKKIKGWHKEIKRSVWKLVDDDLFAHPAASLEFILTNWYYMCGMNQKPPSEKIRLPGAWKGLLPEVDQTTSNVVVFV